MEWKQGTQPPARMGKAGSGGDGTWEPQTPGSHNRLRPLGLQLWVRPERRQIYKAPLGDSDEQ